MNTADQNLLTACVLEILAVRHPVPLSARMIYNRAAMELEFAFAESDVVKTAQSLAEIQLLASVPDETASEIFWRATEPGLLAWKRKQMRRKI